jgi:hypothetical protein
VAATDPPYTASDIGLGPERDLLAVLYAAAVASNPALAEPAGAMGAGLVSAQFMLERLARSKTLAHTAHPYQRGRLMADGCCRDIASVGHAHQASGQLARIYAPVLWNLVGPVGLICFSTWAAAGTCVPASSTPCARQCAMAD